MFMRSALAPLALLALPAIAHADQKCADNFLSGNADSVIDAQTGVPINILPYAATGYAGAGYSYTIDLGGGGYGTPVDPPVEPPVQPGFMDDLALAPNAAGATRLTFPGDGTARLTGPNTDFIFTGVDPTGLFVDGNLIARAGSGIINGEQTMAVVDANGIALTLGSGFNVTRTRGVDASFANGVVLDTIVQIGTSEPPAGGFTSDLRLQPNALGVTRLVFPGDGTARLIGPGTDFTFTGVDPSALAFDGPLVATGGSGTINGEATTAVQLIDDVATIVLTLSAGFNSTGTRNVSAQFANGARLDAIVERP